VLLSQRRPSRQWRARRDQDAVHGVPALVLQTPVRAGTCRGDGMSRIPPDWVKHDLWRDLEHFPPKWAPVRRRKCDQTKESRACSDSIGSKHALARRTVRDQTRLELRAPAELVPEEYIASPKLRLD